MTYDIKFDLIINFLERVGFPFAFREITQRTFVPGLLLSEGMLFINQEKCTFIGDILHEAGHLSVLTPTERTSVDGDVGEDGEMAAMLWSYAAALEIGLDPKTVFHSDGYKGDSDWLLDRYAEGTFIGMPLLQYYGLALNPDNPIQDGPVFPKMLKWLRDEPKLNLS
ncbi:MAG: hypothetical protein P8H62_05960 [Henriciella sp.]|nr:hypothetical protein [Henriciella sp.]